MSDTDASASSAPGIMPPTLWSQVEVFPNGQDQDRALAAAQTLFEHYRRPIVNWLLRKGVAHHRAEDLAQDFLSRFLTPAKLGNFRRGKAKFRSFLLTALNHFEIDVLRKQGRLGDTEPIDENRAARVPPPDLDVGLDRDLAQKIQDRVLERLRSTKYAKPEALRRFETLRHLILDEAAEGEFERLASELAVTVNNLRQILYRLRDDHYEAFRAEVAQLTEPAVVEEEFRYLLGLLIE